MVVKQFDAKTLKDASPVVKELLSELWAELETIVDHIMSSDDPEWPSAARTETHSWRKQAEEWQKWGEWRGQAQGVAYAIAVLSNPYKPNIEEVRAEAMRRWEEE